MKLIFKLSILITLFFYGCQTQDKTADFKKMVWLAGTWQGEADGQPFFEHWELAGPTEFENINFSLCNGDTIVNNHSKIEIRKNKIHYTSGDLVWELKLLTDSQIVFENSKYDEQFTFTHTNQGQWNAVLKYPKTSVEYNLSKTKTIKELLTDSFQPIEGNYAGHVEYNGKKLFTSIHFFSQNGKQEATVSTPASLQLNQPFRSVCVNLPFVKLALQDGTKLLELNGKFENEVITGNVSGEIPATLYLEKTESKAETKNYRIEPVAVQNGTVVLSANLFIPVSSTPVSAVIMICGSGKHIKEEYNGWADLLASKGIAVLTYDKRNVTDFPELNIRQKTSDIVLPGELESDVQAAVELLKKRKDINPHKIGLLGFSQGAVIAPIVAAGNSDIAFLVAISGNTTTDKEFIIYQTLNRLKARNISPEQVNKTEKLLNALFQYVKDRKNGSNLQDELDKAYETGNGQYGLPRHLPNDDEIKYLSTWNSFEHDPAKYWSRLTIPCYVVYGELDQLIPVERSVVILNNIFSAKQSLLTLKVYKGADHFIKSIPDRSNFDFPKFAGGYIEDMANWILQNGK